MGKRGKNDIFKINVIYFELLNDDDDILEPHYNTDFGEISAIT